MSRQYTQAEQAWIAAQVEKHRNRNVHPREEGRLAALNGATHDAIPYFASYNASQWRAGYKEGMQAKTRGPTA